jgi:SecDF, P1 head subdomain
MKTIRQLLRDADPLRHEPTWPPGERDSRRQAVLAAASSSRSRAEVRSSSRIVVFSTVALVVIVVLFLAFHVWSPLVRDVQAAVHFEVRLAEDHAAPGLHEAKVSGTERSVYLHNEVIVDNGDIAAARVIQGGGPYQYVIDIKFKASGAEKMRAATGNHIGKPMAILLDGKVIMAPVVRTPIDATAIVSGDFTKTQAERIVSGMRIQ